MTHVFEEDDNFVDSMAFGEFIRKKRRLMGMNQTDFSMMLGFYMKTVSDWELGKTSPPIEVARQIISSLGGKLLIVNESNEVCNCNASQY